MNVHDAIGEVVKSKGIHGAILDFGTWRMIDLESGLFSEDPNEEEDYLDVDLGFILELVRYT